MEKVIIESMGWNINTPMGIPEIGELPPNTKLSQMVINPYSFGSGACTPGADLETNTSTSGGAPAAGFVYAFPLTATVDECYDQLALSENSHTGNHYIGCYDDGTNMDILATSGDIAIPSGYTFTSVTEFTMTATDPWIAYIHQTAINIDFATDTRRYKNTGYAALPDPYSGYTEDAASNHRMKAGHT